MRGRRKRGGREEKEWGSTKGRQEERGRRKDKKEGDRMKEGEGGGERVPLMLRNLSHHIAIVVGE